jgi:hypothetical protein
MLHKLKNLLRPFRPTSFDVVVCNRIENIVVFNLYDEGLLCSSGMRLEEARFRHFLDRLGITDYYLGSNLDEYTEAMTDIAEKRDLVVLPNGGVMSKKTYEELTRGK